MKSKTKAQLILELANAQQEIKNLQSILNNKETKYNKLLSSHQALQADNERLLLSLEASQDAIFDVNIPANEIYFNSNYYTMLGYKPFEFSPTHENWISLVHPEDKDRVLYALQQLLENKKKKEIIEYRIKTKSGAWCWILSRGKIICQNNTGEPIRLIGSNVHINDRKLLEDELHYEKEFTENAINALKDTLFVFDPQTGKAIKWNQAFNLITGCSDEEIQAKKAPDDWYSKDDLINARAALEKISRGEKATVEMSLICKNGEKVKTEYIASLIKDKNGDSKYIIAIGRDITQREKTLKKLREREETIRALVETSKDWIWSIDINGTHTYCNPAIKKILGYKQEEMIGKNAFDFIHENDREKIKAMLPKIISQKNGWNNLLIRWRHKNGTYRYLESNAVPILNSKSDLIGFRGVDRDITQHIKMTEKLKTTNERLQLALQVNNLGTYDLNLNTGKIVYNERTTQILGYSSNSIRYAVKQWVSRLHPDDRFRTLRIWKEHVGDKRPVYSLECRIKDNYGNWKWVWNIGKKIKKTNHNEVRLVGTIQDITDQKNTNDKIKHALEEKEVLLRELHHRTKNNMQIISSLLQLQSKSIKDKKIIDIFQKTKDRIFSMALVHQKLYRSQNLSYINFQEYVTELSQQLIQSYTTPDTVELILNINNFNIMLDTAVPCGLILTELITNILKHAISSTTENIIKVTVSKSDTNEINIIVKDNGPGFDNNFNFYKCKSMGLQIVHAIVQDQLNGSIDFKNNNGTTCIIKFIDNLYQSRV